MLILIIVEFERAGRTKAAVNAPHSTRSAQFANARQSRSVWSARGFSTAFGQSEDFNATGLAETRLAALESDLSRRNQMKAEGAGKTGEALFAILRRSNETRIENGCDARPHPDLLPPGRRNSVRTARVLRIIVRQSQSQVFV